MSKVVLITGASSGIGLAIAQYLVNQSYTVYGTSRNPKNNIEKGVHMVALDVTKPATIAAAVTSVLEKEGRLDYLINNAGMGITGPLEETPDAEIKRVFETNYFGALEVIKAVLPTMRKQRSGMVINITSIAGYMGLPYRGIYSATKGALGITTEAYRMELKEFNVKMTTVAPGDFATNIAAGRYHAPVLHNSPYKENYKNTLSLMDAHVDEGMDTVIMAKVVKRVMESKNPKVHYRVGFFMQRFSIALKRILPDTWYEKLLLNHYKL
ncbi:short-subunit dehydrogenase [Dokdonia sp. Hel_I_63]|jgi:NAD(P)-dependent dehydrogenase (short-subunit alcohol dehydrogenase family)|uniref:SDR family oxidoreductase n=1 Tax=unclassified Dokdonia TaxID=2615033 RepID=UPI00020A754D|nr:MULTISPECIES: SDR family oxidoreductase [unclassified Dokdonia]AEE20884.1 short-chain dehydrogenase/reductase SDR [Dokdonia sp. 4H-3-7-5]TVZ22869.1 short-subunit dehydrogenase [Dokdonia sp. Hel_I_63]